MLSELPAPGSTWIYTGHGKACGSPHFILVSGPNEIITWTHPESNHPDQAGLTWLGRPEEFFNSFDLYEPT